MDRLRYASAFLGLVATCLGACSALTGDDSESSADGVSISGRWRLPASVADEGAKMRVTYTGAPIWNPRSCAGGPKRGTMVLGRFLENNYSAITSVGGYACRRNTANGRRMSVHGTGRALDIFIPTVGGRADNTKGDALANWLVLNSEKIGVQLIIWDRSQWQANGRNDRAYSGPNPHVDHLHVEITPQAASQQTPFFSETDAGLDFDLDDAGAAPDETDADAGSELEPELDADGGVAPDDDEEPEPPPTKPPPTKPTADAGTPTTPTTKDAGAGTSTEPPPAAESPSGAPADETSTTSTEPEMGDEEPAEGESVGTPPRARSRASSSDSSESSGCSATPMRTHHGARFAIPFGLVLAATALRRRRR